MMKYLLSLGSNLGDRLDNLFKALESIQALSDRKLICSSVYETKALLPEKHTLSCNWDKNFFNMCVLLEYEDCPVKLLNQLKQIESYLGRPKEYEKWSPRIIDIDILISDNGIIVNENSLIIPHAEMLNRLFVLYPASEIAGKLIHPVTGKSIEKHLNSLLDECCIITTSSY